MNDKGVAGGNVGADTVWLTYQELAAKLGVDLTSAQRRALQEKWPRRPGNDGKARVGVPQEVLADAENDGKPVAPDTPSDHGAAMLLLQEQLQAALARLEGEVERLNDRVKQAWMETAAARRETTAALQRVLATELEMAKLKGEKEAAEATLAQIRARGLWARLLNR